MMPPFTPFSPRIQIGIRASGNAIPNGYNLATPLTSAWLEYNSGKAFIAFCTISHCATMKSKLDLDSSNQAKLLT